jgi:hypothetical protein
VTAPEDRPNRPPPASAARPARGGRVVLVAGGVVGLGILYLLAVHWLPRWWSQRVGDQVDGSTTQGVGVGLFYGFVFTLLALAFAGFVLRRWTRSWKAWLVAIGGAALLAAPNLMTLGIVAGSSSAAHAGDRTLDVEAPFFRGGVLFGAIAAGLAYAALQYVLVSRRRGRREAQRLRDDLRTRDSATTPGPE